MRRGGGERRKEEEWSAGERGEGQSTNPSSANPHRGEGQGRRRVVGVGVVGVVGVLPLTR